MYLAVVAFHEMLLQCDGLLDVKAGPVLKRDQLQLGVEVGDLVLCWRVQRGRGGEEEGWLSVSGGGGGVRGRANNVDESWRCAWVSGKRARASSAQEVRHTRAAGGGWEVQQIRVCLSFLPGRAGGEDSGPG